MKALVIIITFALATTTSCLIRPTSAPQDLRQISGGDLNKAQLSRSMRIKKISARAIMKRSGCQALTDKYAWHDTEAGDGFLSYRMKDVSCKNQFLAVDLQAAFFMEQHNITCSLNRNKLLQLHIPNDNSSDIIKVDCKTRLIDVNFHHNTLRIATFEDNGNTYLATVDQRGNIGSGITRIIEGIPPQQMAEIKKELESTSFKKNIGIKQIKYIIGSNSISAIGLPAFLKLSNFATTVAVGTTATAATYGAVSLALFVLPLGAAVSLGIIGRAFAQAHHAYKEVVPMMRALVNLRLDGNETVALYEQPQMPSPQPNPSPT